MKNTYYDKVEQFCKEQELFQKGDGIIIGISGGADSVFLAKALYYMKEKWKLQLQGVHVNHGIRGEEALRDQEYAVQFCHTLGIPCKVYRENIPKLAQEWKMSQEEAGRKYRYQVFETLRKELGFQWIAVAHHEDDQAETILFQMVRGSSLRGMGGMRPKRDHIIRPLLCIRREQIEEQLEQEEIAYCTDSTNLEDMYARNQFRHHVIPYMQEKIQSATVEHIAATGAGLQEVMDYIDEQSLQAYEQSVYHREHREIMTYDAFVSLHKVLQKEVILRMIQRLAGRKKDITAVHIRDVQKIFLGETGKNVHLPYGLQAEKSYDKLIIEKRDSRKSPKEKITGKIVWDKEYILEDEEDKRYSIRFYLSHREKNYKNNEKNLCTKCFDYAKMDSMPTFRYPENGDYLWLDTEGHTKKLSRLFIDEKVPAKKRSKTLVLAINHHILWVPVLGRCSAYYYISQNTREMICADIQKSSQEKGGAS